MFRTESDRQARARSADVDGRMAVARVPSAAPHGRRAMPTARYSATRSAWQS